MEKHRHNVEFRNEWWIETKKNEEHLNALKTILKHETKIWLLRAIKHEIKQLEQKV